jgi:hypothetical protein
MSFVEGLSSRSIGVMMFNQREAEIAALRLIVGNLVARMARATDDDGQSMLREMGDQCKLAAEHMSVGPDRPSLVRETHIYLDEFFKGITITT